MDTDVALTLLFDKAREVYEARVRQHYTELLSKYPDPNGLKNIAATTVVSPDGTKFSVTPPPDSSPTDEEIINQAREEVGKKRLNWKPLGFAIVGLFLVGFLPAWVIYFVGRYIARGFGFPAN